jgi:hypothetical protein
MEQAKIRSEIGDVGQALALWKLALSAANSDPNANAVGLALAARSAAILCAKQADWMETTNFIDQAAARAAEFADERFAAGILADAAHANFRAGHRAECVRLAADALEHLTRVPNSKADIRDFYAHKSIGHLMTWLAQAARKDERNGLPEPRFGSCSLLEPNEKVLQANSTPLSVSQAQLIELAESLEVPLAHFGAWLSDLRNSPYPMVRSLVAQSEFSEGLRTGAVEGALDHVDALVRGLIDTRRSKSKGVALWEPHTRTPQDPAVEAEPEWVDPEFWIVHLCQALLAASIAGQPIRLVVPRWQDRSRELNVPAAVAGWITSVQAMAELDDRAWFGALHSVNEHWSRRVVACSLILNSEAPDPSLLIHVHSVLLRMSDSPLAVQFEKLVCRVLTYVWRGATERPFALRLPRSTVPALLTACDLPGESWQKTAALFLAAIPAVTVRVGVSIISWAERLAGFRR